MGWGRDQREKGVGAEKRFIVSGAKSLYVNKIVGNRGCRWGIPIHLWVGGRSKKRVGAVLGHTPGPCFTYTVLGRVSQTIFRFLRDLLAPEVDYMLDPFLVMVQCCALFDSSLS